MEREESSGISTFTEGLYLLARYRLIAIVIAVTTAIAALFLVILLVGTGFIISAPLAPMFTFYEAMPLFTLFGMITILAVTIIGLGISLLFQYRGARKFREAVDHSEGDWARDYGTPATLIYYGSLLALAGVVTLIILVGAILLLLGLILVVAGDLLLGMNLRRSIRLLETPGLLIMIGAAMLLLSILPFLGFLSLPGLILEAIGFYMIYTTAPRIREEAVSGQGQSQP